MLCNLFDRPVKEFVDDLYDFVKVKNDLILQKDANNIMVRLIEMKQPDQMELLHLFVFFRWIISPHPAQMT
ncbi:hypothetical protein P4597_20885 [Peribacillus simplex]|uniref:hypothetical protein n=1 Tax=Peribacillus simplex TaxID=1478 RepID=UPI002E207F93|nr:hypothetical protein [Peribacillus simplex]